MVVMNVFNVFNSGTLSRLCPQPMSDCVFTIIRLPWSSLGGGRQERPISDSLQPCFNHTSSTHLQREGTQTLEDGAVTGYLEDSQLHFKDGL